jgi:hypothetical protein
LGFADSTVLCATISVQNKGFTVLTLMSCPPLQARNSPWQTFFAEKVKFLCHETAMTQDETPVAVQLVHLTVRNTPPLVRVTGAAGYRVVAQRMQLQGLGIANKLPCNEAPGLQNRALPRHEHRASFSAGLDCWLFLSCSWRAFALFLFI